MPMFLLLHYDPPPSDSYLQAHQFIRNIIALNNKKHSLVLNSRQIDLLPLPWLVQSGVIHFLIGAHHINNALRIIKT